MTKEMLEPGVARIRGAAAYLHNPGLAGDERLR
jgi:hypothetical protein